MYIYCILYAYRCIWCDYIPLQMADCRRDHFRAAQNRRLSLELGPRRSFHYINLPLVDSQDVFNGVSFATYLWICVTDLRNHLPLCSCLAPCFSVVSLLILLHPRCSVLAADPGTRWFGDHGDGGQGEREKMNDLPCHHVPMKKKHILCVCVSHFRHAI